MCTGTPSILTGLFLKLIYVILPVHKPTFTWKEIESVASCDTWAESRVVISAPDHLYTHLVSAPVLSLVN